MIPYGHQDITQGDVDAVIDVLRSDFLTQGPAVPLFEQAIRNYVGAKHGVAVNSATSALHIACLALDLGPGDWLWTVPNTFVASANCGLYCGADIDFVDIDPQTWNMSTVKLREKLAVAKKTGQLPKILIPIHFGGQATDQEEIWELAQEYDFRVIEDASHAIGGASYGEPIGSCLWSDITVFSFHPVKIITSGEGGMALTNEAELAARMTLLRSHGITRDVARLQGGNTKTSQGPAPWYYEQQMLGFNYRMTDIQAVLGTSQFMRLDEFIERRQVLAQRYNLSLDTLPLQLPVIKPENQSAFHLYVVRLQTDSLSRTYREVFERLRKLEIGVNLHYMPVYLQPYYRALGFSPGLCPEAESYSKEAITIPLFPSMTDDQQDQVIETLFQVLVNE